MLSEIVKCAWLGNGGEQYLAPLFRDSDRGDIDPVTCCGESLEIPVNLAYITQLAGSPYQMT